MSVIFFTIVGVLWLLMALTVIGELKHEVPLTADEVTALAAEPDDTGYWLGLLVALDIFVNAFIPSWLLGPTVVGETISARCGRFAMAPHTHPFAIALAWFLNLFQTNHAPKAVIGGLRRSRALFQLSAEALHIVAPTTTQGESLVSCQQQQQKDQASR